jgi:hypothetical protein
MLLALQMATVRLSLRDILSDPRGMTMATIIALAAVWAVVTIVYIALVMYRSHLIRQESDWIPLTEDDREDRAIRSQTVIEMKTQKLSIPIKAFGTLSVVLLLVVVGYWLYQGIVTPPAMPK